MSEDHAGRLIRELKLVPHPEGGHFREVFRSSRRVSRGELSRSALTTIYFLLRAGERSRWHVVDADEAWHFLRGAALELLTYDPEAGRLARRRLNGALRGTHGPVSVVPAGNWQAARSTGAYSLAGCTVGPGFEFADFRFVADLPGHERAFTGPLADFRDLL